MSSGDEHGRAAKRAVTGVCAGLVCLVVLWGCGSSGAHTAVGSRSGAGGGTGASATTELPKQVAALVGQWANVQGQTFCAVGGAIEVGGSPGETTVPPTAGDGSCNAIAGWDSMITLDVDSAGRLATTFDSAGAAGTGSTTPQQAGRCTAQVTMHGTHVHFSDFRCVGGDGKPAQLDGANMAEPTLQVFGVCLRIGDGPDEGWFAKHPGACDAHMSSAEKKFNRVGNAIANAS